MHLFKIALLRTYYYQIQAVTRDAMENKISIAQDKQVLALPDLTVGNHISQNSVQTTERILGISNCKAVSVEIGVLIKPLDGLKRKSRGYHWATYVKVIEF